MFHRSHFQNHYFQKSLACIHQDIKSQHKIISLISLSHHLLLVYGNAGDFCLSIQLPVTAKLIDELQKFSGSFFRLCYVQYRDFPGGSEGKASVYNVGEVGSIPESGRSSGEGNCNPFQYSCLENSMDGGVWQAIAYGVTKSQRGLSHFTSCVVSCHLHTNNFILFQFGPFYFFFLLCFRIAVVQDFQNYVE